MMRISVLVLLLSVCAGNAGCCCCNWWRQPAPAPCPPPAPACDPCTTAPVTYGAPAPVVPYTPPPQW